MARILAYKHMDIEDYCFAPSEIPYTRERSREECLRLMLADMQRHPSFVLCAVTGDFGEEIMSMYALAVHVTAPRDVRMMRIRQRAFDQHGERILEGGDMFEQEENFFRFAASRPLARIEQWAAQLSCPVLRVDGMQPISENAQWIAAQYASLS